LLLHFDGALTEAGNSLARAYTLQGDTAKARAAYQDFLTLERRRCGYSCSETSEGGVREVAVADYSDRLGRRSLGVRLNCFFDARSCIPQNPQQS